MATKSLEPRKRLSGSIRVPGDKSLSHRGLIFGALAEGRSEIKKILKSADIESTESCLRTLGVAITHQGDSTFVTGPLQASPHPNRDIPLDCGNSGTTMRLLTGVLSGLPGRYILTGDESLSRRPMGRVIAPLGEMGARIEANKSGLAPLRILGNPHLNAIRYELPVASAQVKSAILLAALSAQGQTQLTGLIQSRDHTERLLPHFGAEIETSLHAISIRGPQRLRSARFEVPGDISSAAFWMAGSSLLKGSSIQIRDVLLNPSRTGFIEVLKRMGGKIELKIHTRTPECVGDIEIQSSSLRGTTIEPNEIPSLIDELPIIAVLGCAAQGDTLVLGAEELRFKESDRIQAIVQNLQKMGAKIESLNDGFIVHGPCPLQGAETHSFGDHRIAMAMAIASLNASGSTLLHDPDCIDISYPDFFKTLDSLSGAAQ